MTPDLTPPARTPAGADHAESGASAARHPAFGMITTGVRDDEDAATVIAILTALAGAAAGEPEAGPTARSVWGDPAHRLGQVPASPVGWWASGVAR